MRMSRLLLLPLHPPPLQNLELSLKRVAAAGGEAVLVEAAVVVMVAVVAILVEAVEVKVEVAEAKLITKMVAIVVRRPRRG